MKASEYTDAKFCEDVNGRMGEYADGGDTEMHSDDIRIERKPLSDGSVAFNVVFMDEKAAKIRFACVNEKAAWDFADALAACSWVECI